MKARGSWFGVFAVGLPLAASCAVDRGTGFATIERATLSVSLEQAAGDVGEGTWLTGEGYEISIERAFVHVDRMELQQLTGDSDSQSFDPANPPTGYSLCHSDHCHDEDGMLVDYEAIEVLLAGGPAAFSPVVTLGFDEPLSLTQSKSVAAEHYHPSRELDRVSLRRVLVVLARLELEGSVGQGNLGSEAVPLLVDLALGTELGSMFQPVAIDRDGPKQVRLSASVTVDPTLFDGIDFADILTDGSVTIDEPESFAARTLAASLADSETRATLD